jgi:hypothetical protein
MEPPARHKQVGKKETARLVAPNGVILRVTSYRRRLCDSDGVSVKAFLDGIVRAGILADDNQEVVKETRFAQYKDSNEMTVIEIHEAVID